MREALVEAHLVRRVKSLGGLCYKFTSPARRSVPDRLCIIDGVAFFVELKAPGKKPTPKQAAEIELIRSKGIRVFVADTKEAVDAVLQEFGL